jgi:DNA uptake protein ComE-like DNA-binding protein
MIGLRSSRCLSRLATVAALAAALVCLPKSAGAQVASGLQDPNTLSEAELAALPHATPALAKAAVAARPFLSIIDFDRFLAAQGLTPDQRTAVYRRAFVHVNLDTASEAELLLIPGVGKRMAHEFEEYRPWKAWAQFDKEIGKYVDAAEVARLKQYTFIPIRLNTASDADFLSIPGVGPRMVGEFKEYRPWKAQAQFQKEIGKYVSEKEVARLWRYMRID